MGFSEYINDVFGKFGSFFNSNGFNILAGIFILIIGYFIIKLVSKGLMRIVYATKIDNAVGGFFVSLFKVFLWIILLFIVASLFGITGNSFLVAFSSVALAVGLALKDSLANIANGIVIIMTKPFKKGDHVSVNGIEGVIKNIKILTVELFTFDNKKIIVPNSTIVSSSVINYTANPTRRLDFTFSVSYDSDMKFVKKVIYDTIMAYNGALKIPAPTIYMKEQSASSVDFAVRVWVNTTDYFSATGAINEIMFEAFKTNNIEIPYQQIDLRFRNRIEVGDNNAKKN